MSLGFLLGTVALALVVEASLGQEGAALRGVGGVVLPGHPHHPRGVQVGGAPLLHPPPPLQAHHRHLQVLHVKFMRLK